MCCLYEPERITNVVHYQSTNRMLHHLDLYQAQKIQQMLEVVYASVYI